MTGEISGNNTNINEQQPDDSMQTPQGAPSGQQSDDSMPATQNSPKPATPKPATPMSQHKSGGGSKELWFYIMVAVFTGIIIFIFFTKAYTPTSSADGIADTQVMAGPDGTIVSAIRQHSRIYTAEATSHKTMTYTSNNKLSFNIGGVEKGINLPFGKTEATIPVSVTYKAYIDLDRVTDKNIDIVNDTTLIVTLPDPVILQTALAIDHDKEQMTKEIFGKALTAEQYKQLVRQAKESAWNELDDNDQRAIVETAKVSASDILLPQLRALGFRKIIIDYRQDYTIEKLIKHKD